MSSGRRRRRRTKEESVLDVQFSCRISKRDEERLRRLSRETGLSMSELIRAAIGAEMRRAFGEEPIIRIDVPLGTTRIELRGEGGRRLVVVPIQRHVTKEDLERLRRTREEYEAELEPAPLCEADVRYLFRKYHRLLGFSEVRVNKAYEFPDAIALTESGKEVKIEFEYMSSNYVAHQHSLDCDLIVCWVHDWRFCPVEVLEMRDKLGRFVRQ